VGRVSNGGSNKGAGEATPLADGPTALKDRLVAASAAVSADDLRRNSRRECGCNQVCGSGVTVGQCRASGQKASIACRSFMLQWWWQVAAHDAGARQHSSARSAGLHPAVSRIWNPQSARQHGEFHNFARSAECNSAIQQIKNLRYEEFCHAPP
jgi:hypothetical protein